MVGTVPADTGVYAGSAADGYLHDVAAMEDPQQYALDVGARPSAMRVYKVVVTFIRKIMNPYFKVEVHGLVENLNIEGPLILAPVHRSNLDSMLVAGASSRRTRALAKHTMFDKQPFAWLVASLGAFPVERGTADREALRAARMLLDNGEAMFVFPEGTRQEGQKIGDIYDGVAYLAAKTGAQVVPVGIAGTGQAMAKGTKFPKRVKVIMEVGEIMQPPIPSGKRVTVGDRARFSAQLGEVLQELMDEAHAKQAAS
jgi:1-acyl-sn-glycerol-3-phosphate acyltransferase